MLSPRHLPENQNDCRAMINWQESFKSVLKLREQSDYENRIGEKILKRQARQLESRILVAAGRLGREVVFGPSWPLEDSIGTKIYIKL